MLRRQKRWHEASRARESMLEVEKVRQYSVLVGFAVKKNQRVTVVVNGGYFC